MWQRSQGFKIRKSSNDTRVCNKGSFGSDNSQGQVIALQVLKRKF
ncbi:unnamed protein product [Arabidopsis lyrata]|nr:unnamed protein product [Arabidopsis lyrata]